MKSSFATSTLIAALLIGTSAPALANLPQGNYQCTQSQVFHFNETGDAFGVASVLSTDTSFTIHTPREDGSLIYQFRGTTYLIDKLEDDFSRFKFRVVYSGDLRSLTGFCRPFEEN